MNAYEKRKLEAKERYDEWKYGPREIFLKEALNPDYKPWAKNVWAATTASMEQDNFYDEHSREECAVEWRRRYEELSKKEC